MDLTSEGEHPQQGQLRTARPWQESLARAGAAEECSVAGPWCGRPRPERRLKPGRERPWKAWSSMRSWT